MPVKSALAGSWGVGSAVAVAHIAALAALAHLDGATAAAQPQAIQVAFAVPEAPTSDPGPVPDEKPSVLPEATPLPAAPSPDPVRAPDAVVATTDASHSSSAVEEIPPRTDPAATPSASSAPASSDGGGAGGDDGPGEGELAESSDYLTNPAPSYPLASRLLGEEGRVLLRVLVDTSGRSRSVVLHKSSGLPRLDGSALSAVWSWKFHPARRGGRAVEAWVIVPIRFSLKGA